MASEPEAADSELLVRRHPAGVTVLILNRPDARNAISSALRARLVDALAALQDDDDVRAIVLTGTDPAFSAGVDAKELAADPAMARTVGPLLSPVIRSDKPLIGAINGPAYTGGLELALACHWLVASENARFADTHAKLGLTPGWGLTVLLAEAVGTRRARQLATTALPIDATTARDWGLVNEVTPHGELLPRAIELATAAAANDQLAVRTELRTFDDQRAAADGPLWAIESRNWLDPTTATRSALTRQQPGS